MLRSIITKRKYRLLLVIILVWLLQLSTIIQRVEARIVSTVYLTENY